MTVKAKALLIVVFCLVLVGSAMRFLADYQACSASGGRLVRGVVWFICIRQN